MDSRRALILQEWRGYLDTVAELGTVCYGVYDPGADNVRLPAAGLTPLDEPARIADRRTYDMALTVGIRVCISDSDSLLALDAVLTAVERAVMAGVAGSQIARQAKLVNTHFLYLDKDNPQSGADMIFQIDYHRSIQDPRN